MSAAASSGLDPNLSPRPISDDTRRVIFTLIERSLWPGDAEARTSDVFVRRRFRREETGREAAASRRKTETNAEERPRRRPPT